MKRHVYLSMKSLEEAKNLFLDRFIPGTRTGVEWLPTEKALGRVTSNPVFARISAPTYHAAAMDGIAVRAEATYGTTEKNPGRLKIGQDAVWINTGQFIPKGYNAVIMVEKLNQVDEETLEIHSSAYPWQHVRKVGEDIVATQMLFPQDHLLRSQDLGALISAGVFSLEVREKPRVVIIPTGSELIDHKVIENPDHIQGHKIIESNSVVLSGMVTDCQAEPIVYDIVPDEMELILKAVKKALASEAHLIIINAGSSAGSRDYTAHIIAEMGEVLVHGVAMMPGKPTILGVIEGKPVIGNPGYMVSAALSFEQFVKPLVYSLQGLKVPAPQTIMVRPSRDIPSKLGTEEFLRVNIGQVGSKTVATPLSRAAGSITTLTRAEGILRIPAHSEGVGQDEEVEAELLVGRDEIENNIVIIGSHDITIDILADEIRSKGERVRISSGNVGSLGGLMALRKGICHMAGSHLLDTETKVYNLSYIERYLKNFRVWIYHLVLRDQGLIVPKGNPKGIEGLEDLTRKDIVFVNRQTGSGTRVLFDYRLQQLDIKPEKIRGYDREEYTHMTVAVDILSGAADCGMGIYAAARALDLNFIAIEQEQYDLIIPEEMIKTPKIQRVLKTIGSHDFKKRVEALGGYNASKSGELWKKVG